MFRSSGNMHQHLLFAIFIFFAFQGLFSCKSVKKEVDKIVAIDTLQYNWQIQSSDSLKNGGKIVSSKTFKSDIWYSARVSTTVLNVLVQHWLYKDIFHDENMRKIPKKQFKTWWYRTSFQVAYTTKIKNRYLKNKSPILKIEIYNNNVNVKPLNN